MEHLAKKFIISPTEQNGYVLLQELRKNNLHHTSLLLSSFISKLYHHNIPSIREGAISAFHNKKYKLSYDLYTKALSFPALSEKESFEIRFNRHFSIPYISDRYIHYPTSIIKKIQQRPKRDIPLVTFTITSCKRFDLFEKTMNSFLNCCKDIDKIDTWFCVDDNSSEDDRNKMKELYPFFNFYWKTPTEKGHPRSMNIIRDFVKSEFIFHMEDDWKFFNKRNYISDCMSVLSENNSYGQCLINKNYAETHEDISLVGGEFKVAKNGTRYFIHEYTSTKEEQDEFNKKYGNQKNCSYWSHFSFRPSLLRRKILTILGPYNESAHHFEMDYSKKYASTGLKSTFLDGIHCLHIGRLTSERENKLIPNAYTLNEQPQFYVKETAEKTDIGEDVETYIVNLDRRSDRMKEFEKISPVKYTKFSAIDGKGLKPTIQLQQIFEGNNYNMRNCMVGCAMSHLKLLIQLVKSEQKMYCILEDDVTFTISFVQKVQQVLKDATKYDWDLIYLGHHIYPPDSDNGCYNKNIKPVITKWNRDLSLKCSLGGTFGYIITKAGAEKMLNFINTNSMTNGIDTVYQKASNIVNTFYCYPHLVFSEYVTNYNDDKTVDSDIQRDFTTTLTIPLKERLKREVEFYGKDNIIYVEDEEKLSSVDKNVIFIENPTDKAREFVQDKKFYMVGNTMIIVLRPKERHLTNRYFDRLKKYGEWDIDDAFEGYAVSKNTNEESYELVFVPQLDQVGHDIYRLEGDIESFKIKAMTDPNCAGFNTLGFFKNKIENLSNSPYFSPNDGIFIKKKFLHNN